MTDMGKTVVKRIGDLDVVCRELTVGQLRGLLQTATEGDLVADFLFEEARLADLTVLSNLTREQLETLPPSEIRKVVAACAEANPDFFAMMARMARPRPAQSGS